MKLVIQIPCYNEEHHLPESLAAIPRSFEGIDEVELLVIDDGSTDRTSEVASAAGVDRIVRFNSHRGLAAAFAAGLETATAMGADIIVNTDADNQYFAPDIERLIHPILHEDADIVVGCRPIESIEHFSALKKKLQRVGSAVVRYISNTEVPDATSGFRAFSRHAAGNLFIYTQFSHTLETLIHAGKKSMNVAYVNIRVNGKTRESRLFSSNFDYLKQSAATMLRLYLFYEPLKTFAYLSAFIMALGLALLSWPSLFDTGGRLTTIPGLGCFFLAVITFVVGVLADMNASNKRVMEETLRRVRQLETRPSEPKEYSSLRRLNGKRAPSRLQPKKKRNNGTYWTSNAEKDAKVQSAR